MRKSMITILAAASLALLPAGRAAAQDTVAGDGPSSAGKTVIIESRPDSIPEGYMLTDTVVYVRAAAVDSALAGKNIFREMPIKLMGGAADVKVHQSLAISTAMNRHFIDNAAKQMQGYRVRIFFDNRQSARTDSETTLKRFEAAHHDVAAYRSYVNPYFKVTVGDFRTKSEAMQLLEEIKREFPAAFIVKENINYPVVDKDNAVRADTLHVLRPLPEGAVTL